jgi:gas vesicle protein
MSRLASDAREDREDRMDREGANGGLRTFGAGLLIGALVGAGIALLVAPSSGEETRRMLSRRARRLAADARDRYDDARHEIKQLKERRRREHDDASAG